MGRYMKPHSTGLFSNSEGVFPLLGYAAGIAANAALAGGAAAAGAAAANKLFGSDISGMRHYDSQYYRVSRDVC